MDFREYLEKGSDHFLPNLSIDLVIIGYRDRELKCLLLKIGDRWLLPGGHIRIDESVVEAVSRILKDRTALENPHMSFLSVFGNEDRHFSEEFQAAFENLGIAWKKDYWINKRFVTLAYYSLVDIENTYPEVKAFDEAFAWFSFDDLPEMWMDHKTIAQKARDRLKQDVKKELVVHNLLPIEFTMPELHRLYQAILEEKLDRSRFQKKMLSTGAFERMPEQHRKAPGRNPYRYRIKQG
ncbi:MAG: NUDIX domain-containing protein [Bacteroidota bacterium]